MVLYNFQGIPGTEFHLKNGIIEGNGFKLKLLKCEDVQGQDIRSLLVFFHWR